MLKDLKQSKEKSSKVVWRGGICIFLKKLLNCNFHWNKVGHLIILIIILINTLRLNLVIKVSKTQPSTEI